ncbi:ABC transporter permease [bacterium]|jgi:ABC-2 type transport system permease protein|nr:ABC transporter permease [bacterium]
MANAFSVRPLRPRAGILAAWTLAEREVVRFLRQPNRVIGALGQPIIFWVFLGLGLRGSFRPQTPSGSVPYDQYFFPGVLAMIVLFTAIFSTISIIEDRREGFLQGVLVAPVERFWIVLGKVVGGTVLALLQSIVFLTLAPLAGIPLSLLGVLTTVLLLAVLGIALTSLGSVLAWRTDSVQGFHAVMSILLFPMWFLSGSVFPLEGAPTWLAWVVRLNPLTYGVAGIRRLLAIGGDSSLIPESVASLSVSIPITIGFAVVTFLWATRSARRY